MKHLIFSLLFLIGIGVAPAMAGDCDGIYSPGQVCGNNGASAAPPGPISGVDTNALNTQLVNYQIAPADCGRTIQAGTGSTGFFTITVPSVSGFPATCVVTIINGDAVRGKALNISGTTICSTQDILWPGQACKIGIVNGAWAVLSRPGRWRPPQNATILFYTDFTNGSDLVGVTDGLASGASAFKTAEHCFLVADDQIDFNAVSQTQIQCNLAAATTDTTGMHSPVHSTVGAQGGAALQVVGASLAITGAVSNGGLCKITVSATGTYATNEIVSVYGVGGATGCNGTWKVTVTDGTHLTLQSTTFGGAYTSGGTVTNGSIINTTGLDAIDCYFGTVIQFSNIEFESNVNDLNALWGCKVYLLSGNIFAGSPAAAYISASGPSKIEISADIGLAGAATYGFVAGPGGLISEGQAININFLPGLNQAFTDFVVASQLGNLVFNQATINLNSVTVTGTRCLAQTLGLADSGTGTPDTYFPGNSNSSTATNGVCN